METERGLDIYQSAMIRECLEDHGMNSSDCDSVLEFINEVLEEDDAET